MDVGRTARHVPCGGAPGQGGVASRRASAREYAPSPHEVGMIGERVCAAHLEGRGLEVLERNWRCVFGEVDLVAREGKQVALVEVKTRLVYGHDDLAPELAVDEAKRARYRTLAMAYLATHPAVESLRFDVAGVLIVGEHLAQLRYFENVPLGDEA